MGMGNNNMLFFVVAYIQSFAVTPVKSLRLKHYQAQIKLFIVKTVSINT